MIVKIVARVETSLPNDTREAGCSLNQYIKDCIESINAWSTEEHPFEIFVEEITTEG